MKICIQRVFENKKEEEDYFIVFTGNNAFVGDCINKGNPHETQKNAFYPSDIGKGSSIVMNTRYPLSIREHDVDDNFEYYVAVRMVPKDFIFISNDVFESRSFNKKMFRYVRDDSVYIRNYEKIYGKIMECI